MNRPRVLFAATVAGCLVLVALWVSGQSFWIDECNAAVKAIQPDLRSFWTKFSGMGGSDFQMPLYMFLLWCWEKIVGRGEFALRALNILFAWSAILLVAFRTALPRKFRILWCLAAAVSPMLAAYMDEARPYALQFLAATAMCLPFLAVTGNEGSDRFDFRTFSAGLILLCGSSLTGVVFAFWPCLWLLVSVVRCREFRRFLVRNRVWLAVDVLVLSALAVFYLHTLAGGARASAIGKTGLSTIVFCFYELFGFSGMGPSRLALRSSHASAIKGFLFPLAAYAAAFVPFGLCAVPFGKTVFCGNGRFPRRIGLPVFLAGFGVLSMFVVGMTMDMRVLARHLMPAFPVLLFLFAECAGALIENLSRGWIPVALVLSAMAVSSVSFRLCSRHAKDDYRKAAGIAGEAIAGGKRVWWAADEAALLFYGLGRADEESLVLLANPSEKKLHGTPFPDLILLSKPDIYDGSGSIRNWCEDNSFATAGEFPAFRMLRPAGRP